jgi:hypothetical protein
MRIPDIETYRMIGGRDYARGIFPRGFRWDLPMDRVRAYGEGWIEQWELTPTASMFPQRRGEMLKVCMGCGEIFQDYPATSRDDDDDDGYNEAYCTGEPHERDTEAEAIARLDSVHVYSQHTGLSLVGQLYDHCEDLTCKFHHPKDDIYPDRPEYELGLVRMDAGQRIVHRSIL